MYINDIITDIQSTMKLFADDTSMYSFINDPVIQSQTLNADLNKIDVWAKKWKVNFNQTKTELMVLSRKINPIIPPLFFDDVQLEPIDCHKHLGIILQKDCKWDQHIKSIVTKCRLLINCLRSYKYRLGRRALENIYKAYILPHFDYGDVLWDGCTETQAEELESLHLDALRTIIGTVRGTSHEKIYSESGFTTLSERRKRHKLIMYHKIVNEHVPNYLHSNLPPLVTDNIPYNLRRQYEREGLAWDICRFRDSFFLATSALWNNLPAHIQTSISVSQLKRFLSRDDPIIPPNYFSGERKEQLIHCKLRLGMSDLNQDMVNRHISINSSCACGSPSETAIHFLLQCPLFQDIRSTTIYKLPNQQQRLNILLFGSNVLPQADNIVIFNTVHQFIRSSNRFT
jgi:hypothetical protein